MQNMNTTQIKYREKQEHIATSNVYLKWLFLQKTHRGGGNTRRAPSVDPPWSSCALAEKVAKNMKLNKIRENQVENLFLL